MEELRERASKLVTVTERFGWSDLVLEHGSEAVKRYRQFLVVKVIDDDLWVRRGHLEHGPGPETDAVWHSHMLRPQHYIKVCEALTNGSRARIIEHDPVSSEWDCLKERTHRTKERIERLFGNRRGGGKRVRDNVPPRPVKRRRSPRSSMQIFVKGMSGRVDTLSVTPSDTVVELKDLIKDRTGVPSDQQRLIYSSKQLRDSATLSEYGITVASTVHMVLKLAGC